MTMNINWYPGHMKKTKESIEQNLKKVDLVFELLDARIPYSSRNPIINDIVGNKPVIVILNKSDLSDPSINKLWQSEFMSEGKQSILLNSLSGNGIEKLHTLAKLSLKDKYENQAKKGILEQPIRAMIVGIPNSGKSTLINTLAKRKSAKTGNKPGITKTNQWIKTNEGLQLLDTPGILWPKFDDEEVGLNLAFTGAIKDEILDTETLSLKLIEKLMNVKKEALEERYSLTSKDISPLEVMEQIAKNRGCLLKGGDLDYEKTSRIILDEFRKGYLGKISLERPRVHK